jgi:predicted small integral membrane protein
MKMITRYLKTDLAIFIALFCIFYATQNIVNLQGAYSFVFAVLTMDGHTAYPAHFGPAISSPTLIWISLWIIILMEYLAGLLTLKGAWDMWSARKLSKTDFNAAKKYVMLGAGVALLVWFGLFSAVGGAYFQMWQTELGGAALNGAFQFAVLIGVVALFINMPDPEL